MHGANSPLPHTYSIHASYLSRGKVLSLVSYGVGPGLVVAREVKRADSGHNSSI